MRDSDAWVKDRIRQKSEDIKRKVGVLENYPPGSGAYRLALESLTMIADGLIVLIESE